MDKEVTGFGKEVYNDLRKDMPTPIFWGIIILVIAVGIVIWLFKYILDSSIADADKTKYLNCLLIALACISVIFPIIIIFTLVRHGRRKTSPQTNYNDKTEPQGKITAFIVKQNDSSRDQKFQTINQNVKKTYHVLGATLSSLAEDNKETMWRKMANDGVQIKLCMMDPAIAVDDICRLEIEAKTCSLFNLLENAKEPDGSIKIDYQTLLDSARMSNNLLERRHILIHQDQIRSYYKTVTDIIQTVRTSQRNLGLICKSVNKDYGIDTMQLKCTDSFIPISITIADEEDDDNGKMVVEFHLPFTECKVLFELTKKDNGDLFNEFVGFYDAVWETANPC